MHKQMILPLFDYNKFVLVSCTLEHKQELQKRQNSAIYPLARYILTENMLGCTWKCGMLSLEQRCNIPLLKLMFIRSKNVRYITNSQLYY